MWTNVIDLVDKIAPTRPYRVAWFVVLATACVLAFVPLFNLVGYESAAFFGVLLGILSTGLTIYAVRFGEIEAPLSGERRESPLRDFGRLGLRHSLLGVAALLVFVTNGLRVPTCDWGAGFGFWALIPFFSILMGQAAAWVALSVAGERRFLPWVIAFAFPAADTLALGLHLAIEPPIVGHQWFLGYFGGSIYDEALAVPASLIFYRALHLVALIVVLAAIEATYELRRGRLAPWILGLVAVGIAILGWGYGARKDFGVGIDAAYVAKELGGVVETEHFVIYYSETSAWRNQLDELIDDHEFRYQELREFFGLDPVAISGEKIRSYVYPNRNIKGRLMGGRSTLVAKIWLKEMHILWRGAGDNLLAHELAHIFTESFGAGPLKLSMQRPLGINMGLVEGIAAAAEWPAQELSPHEATAAMRQLGFAPDLRRLFGASGFWTQASGRAYTAMGSFVRFLVDEYGIERFRRAYGWGDFQGAYGKSANELIQEWESFIDGFELSERAQEIARFRYDRPSIFGKTCARARGEQRRLAGEAIQRGAIALASRIYEEILRDEPQNTQLILDYAAALRELGDGDEALALIQGHQEHELARVERARLLEREGDLLWLAERSEEAAAAYGEALHLGVPLDLERSLVIKERLALAGDSRLRAYLLEKPGVVRSIYELSTLYQEVPEDEITAYLLGRRLWQDRYYEAAATILEGAVGRLSAAALDGEAGLMLGQSYYFSGRFFEAKQVFERLQGSAITGYQEAGREWAGRAAWAARNRS